MPQKFLSIKNFEKYQTYKSTNPPWFKIHRSFFGDREVTKLSPSTRYLYLGLIFLATETNNSIANDRTWIAQRLAITEPEVDLRPLYKAGFLKCTHMHRYLSEERREEAEAETEERQIAHRDETRSLRLTDEEWLTEHVRKNPAYDGINIDVELGKMDTWLSTRPHKKKTRRFITNWLNRVEKPVNGIGITSPPKSLVDLL